VIFATFFFPTEADDFARFCAERRIARFLMDGLVGVHRSFRGCFSFWTRSPPPQERNVSRLSATISGGTREFFLRSSPKRRFFSLLESLVPVLFVRISQVLSTSALERCSLPFAFLDLGAPPRPAICGNFFPHVRRGSPSSPAFDPHTVLFSALFIDPAIFSSLVWGSAWADLFLFSFAFLQRHAPFCFSLPPPLYLPWSKVVFFSRNQTFARALPLNFL